MVSEHEPLLYVPMEGVPRDDPGHLSHICGELPRALALKGGDCNTLVH
jgi:hypothetical protein